MGNMLLPSRRAVRAKDMMCSLSQSTVQGRDSLSLCVQGGWGHALAPHLWMLIVDVASENRIGPPSSSLRKDFGKTP